MRFYFTLLLQASWTDFFSVWFHGPYTPEAVTIHWRNLSFLLSMKGKSVTRTCTQHIASHKKIALTSIPTTSAGKIPVGKAARYGLDDSEIESHSEMGGRAQFFPQTSRSPLGATQLPTQLVLSLSRGLTGRGAALTTHPPTSAEVKESVELYIYSPLGLCDLF